MSKSVCCLIASFVLSFQFGFAQSITTVHVDSFTIDSKVLKEACKVYLYLPENYNSTTEKYPVVYLLDGEYYSSYAADVSSLLAQSQLAPACIIIGITSNNRQRDFSPALDENTDQTQDIQFAGGADHFLLYIKNELIPTVDEKYRTLSYRLLIGHSTGGLLAYYSLYKTPGLFHAIISIDGSTWWNKGKVGKEVIEYLSSHPDYKGKIFECRKDIHIPVRYPPNIELLTFLDKTRPVGLEYYYLELPNETHGTIVIPGIYYGLKEIFFNYSKEQN
ncbi:MAG: alpha/beta hydrolase-fold protein [Saprospiraceae bacterium]